MKLATLALIALTVTLAVAQKQKPACPTDGSGYRCCLHDPNGCGILDLHSVAPLSLYKAALRGVR